MIKYYSFNLIDNEKSFLFDSKINYYVINSTNIKQINFIHIFSSFESYETS